VGAFLLNAREFSFLYGYEPQHTTMAYTVCGEWSEGWEGWRGGRVGRVGRGEWRAVRPQYVGLGEGEEGGGK
jgi:hypothetical protein